MMATAQAETPNHLYQQQQSTDMSSQQQQQQQQQPQQSPGAYQQPPNYSAQPPMRYPGKPVPSNGGPAPQTGVHQPSGPPPPGQYIAGPAPPGQHNMRPSYHGGAQNMGPLLGGPQPPTGPTPTLNQLLQSAGGGGSNIGNGQATGGTSSSGSNNNVGSSSGAGASGSGGAGQQQQHSRYPPTNYEHTNSYPPHPIKTDAQQYPTQPPSGWLPSQQTDRGGHPPPHVNNYHPPPQHMVDQQSMYRQGVPPPGPGPNRGQGQAPPPPSHQQYYNPPPGMHPPHGGQYPPVSSHYPPPPPGQPPPQQGRYQAPQPNPGPPGRSDVSPSQPPSHYPGQPQSPHYPPPPSQSSHYSQGQQQQPPPPHLSAQQQRYPPSGRPGEGPSPYQPSQQSQGPYPPPQHRYAVPPPQMRSAENQPPSHYHPVPSPGMTDSSGGHIPPGRPPSASGNNLDGHSSRSTPPPAPSPSLQQQQQQPVPPPPTPNLMNHHPPSPSQSPRSSSSQLQPPPGNPPSHSPSHRATNNYPPPDVGDVTGCNSNDSATGPIGAGGIRPSPSPTGSASSRSMSPAVGNQNIPMPPRPWSGQADSGPPRIPSDHYRSKIKKADSLNKLYEMDDNPDRRMFLDRLLQFMEDLSTPITACPQISKNPLDLFKLYFLVKERGGFLEVTRNKTWKDIAGSLGIGASSSAAYTLRKHYTKHLLPFECKFDRGGIDPQPLINQVEQQTKKKGPKSAPVPSPGSSNSQDSFPGPNSSNNTGSMDSFPGYPSPYGGGSAGGGPNEYPSVTPPGASTPGQQRPPPNQGPAQPSPGQPNQNPPPPLPHSGEGNNVSLSNPFDDMPLRSMVGLVNSPSSHLFQSQSTLTHQGYQGPPGSYPSYPPPGSGEQYGRGPPPPPGHDQYTQQQYPGYPPPGRQIYPGYPPPPDPSPNSQPPPSVQQQPVQPPGPDDGLQRYSMGPPPPASGAPQGAYPPRSQTYPTNSGPPINGYADYYQHPNQDQFTSLTDDSSELNALSPSIQSSFISGPAELVDLLLNYNSPQGYPPLPGSPPQGSPSPTGGKQMPPPPHSSHLRGMNYPIQKEGQQPYPNAYPPQPGPQQQPQQQQRMPPYDQNQGTRQPNYLYPPPSGGAGNTQHNRSSPSPSTNSIPPPSVPHSQSPKQWIPPEGPGWPPNSGGQYQARPYPPPAGSGSMPQSQHSHPASPSATIPPAQSPVAPVSSPHPSQSPSPQPWANSGPPPGSVPPPTSRPNLGPMGTPPAVPWGSHSGGTVVTPQTPPAQASQWSQQPQHQTSHPRHPPRSPFPPSAGKGPEMYKGASGYPSVGPPGGMLPPTGSVPSIVPSPGPKGQAYGQPSASPISQLSSMSIMQSPHSPSPAVFSAPQPTPFSQLPVAAPPVPIKKEIVFPSDSIESVQPVISRRRKLHRSDIAPVEAWRMMMCLKSGLLAETTWAIDVLNVLLYDDFSVTYFSLSCLPGLLDLLLEHLRRSLVLVFGQSVGIEVSGDAKENADDDKAELKWYSVGNRTREKDFDLGAPVGIVDTFNSESRVSILNGTNFTMKTRNSKPVKVIARDEDPFVLPGPREWDIDEKARISGDVEAISNTSIMDLTRHVITNFASDLNLVPIIRVLKGGIAPKSQSVQPVSTVPPVEDIKIKVEPIQGELTLLYSGNSSNCEKSTKNCKPYPRSRKGSTESSSSKRIPPLPNGFDDSSSNSSTSKAVSSKNCLLRSKKDKVRIHPTAVDMEVEENTLIEPPTSCRTPTGKVNEFLSDNVVIMNGLEAESSNQSLTYSTTENSSSDFCDSNNTNNSKQFPPLPVEPTPPPTASTSRNSQSNSTNTSISSYINLRDGGKRKNMDEYEDECFSRDEASLGLVSESQDSLARRCLSLLNILRSLTFVPGNDIELGRSQTFLSLLGKLVLLFHDHPLKAYSKSPSIRKKRIKLEDDENGESNGGLISVGVNQEDDSLEPPSEEVTDDENILAIASAVAAAAATIDAESCTSLCIENQWWWDYLHSIREHVLVILANISGQLDLSQYSEEISRPILDGLLHWAVCPAAYGQDPFPTVGSHYGPSPRRLAIEALCKLSVTQGNVDLLLATPPYSRIERLCQLLSRGLCRTEDQVIREFSVNLLSYLSGADTGVARTIALQNPCISLLIAFIEQAEATARNIVETHGFSVLRDNPESMGTSLDMLRRAATTLHNLAKHPDNRPLFVQHESRLLQLVMSQILEQKVAAIVAQVLFTFSMSDGTGHGKLPFASTDTTDIFYTPSLSRSRIPFPPVPPHHLHPPPHMVPPPANYPPF